jgi:hypothetical protein
VIALAIGSDEAHLTRSVADPYDPYRFDLVAMAAKAGSGHLVNLDVYSATVIRFLDVDRPPRIFPPGASISASTTDARVLVPAGGRGRQAPVSGTKVLSGPIPSTTVLGQKYYESTARSPSPERSRFSPIRSACHGRTSRSTTRSIPDG